MKLPEIVSTSTIPADIPAPHASPEAFGAGYATAAAGLQRVSYTSGEVGGILARQRELADRSSGLAAWSDYKALIDGWDAEKQSMKGADPESLAKERADYRNQALKGAQEGLTEGAKAQFRGHVQAYEPHYQATGVKLYNDLYKDQLMGNYEAIIGNASRSASGAPLSDPLAFQRSIDDGLQAIQQMRGMMGNKWAEEEKNKWLKESQLILNKRGTATDEANARRDFSDPALRQQTVDNLRAGRYQYMLPDDQYKLADSLEQAQDKRVKAQETNAKEVLKAEVEAKESDFDRRVREETSAEQKAAIIRDLNYYQSIRGIGDVAYRRVYDAVVDEKKTPSDPDIRSRIGLDVRTTNPKTTFAEIDKLHAQYRAGLPGLSYEDATQSKDHLKATLESKRKEGESDAMKAYNQAEQELRAWLGIKPGMIEKLTENVNTNDPIQRLYASGLQQLRTRAYPGIGKEDALTVVDEIGPKLQRSTGISKDQQAETIRGQLTAPDRQSLEQMKKSGAISEGAYFYELRLWRQLDKLGPDVNVPKVSSEPKPAVGSRIQGPKK